MIYKIKDLEVYAIWQCTAVNTESCYPMNEASINDRCYPWEKSTFFFGLTVWRLGCRKGIIAQVKIIRSISFS